MKTALRDVLETLILTLFIFLVVRSVVQNFRVEGRSMEPTLRNGQYLLINKATYWRVDGRVFERLAPGAEASADNGGARGHYLFGPPQRGDIIVFRYPKDRSRDFIKRVIAVPGDVVEIKNGTVYINGQALQEDYTAAAPNYPMAPERVPPGSYFVLGDNRNNSSDSHVWGLVPEDHIIGRAWLSYWPPDRWGVVFDQLEPAPAATP
jgi:signal peptidase I